MRGPLKTADEYDALTKWRRLYRWRAGQRSAIKRGARRRERRAAKAENRCPPSPTT